MKLLSVSTDSLKPLLEGDPQDYRLCLGYAGWGPNQLEGELAEGAWWVVDAEIDDALTTDPDDLWSTVLGRQPADLRKYSHFPTDIRTN